jgi:hypothetical protein
VTWTWSEEVEPFLSEASVRVLSSLEPDVAQAVKAQLKRLSVLESAAEGGVSVVGLGEEYRALALPSGFLAIYRHLTPEESKELFDGSDAVLVVDLRPMSTSVPVISP